MLETNEWNQLDTEKYQRRGVGNGAEKETLTESNTELTKEGTTRQFSKEREAGGT